MAIEQYATELLGTIPQVGDKSDEAIDQSEMDKINKLELEKMDVKTEKESIVSLFSSYN